MNKNPLGLDKATADAINQNMNKNPFAGIKQPDPPTEINESVQEIIDAYSLELFDSAISGDNSIRKAAEETLQAYKTFAKREWLYNQDALTRVWNDPAIDEIDMPLVTIPLNDLEGLLVALQVAISAGDGSLEKMFESLLNKERRKGIDNWYTKALIQVCKDIRRGNAPASQEDMFIILSRRAETWIDSEKDKHGDVTVWLTQEGKKPHRVMLAGFKKFEKTYREQIGRKKKL